MTEKKKITVRDVPFSIRFVGLLYTVAHCIYYLLLAMIAFSFLTTLFFLFTQPKESPFTFIALGVTLVSLLLLLGFLILKQSFSPENEFEKLALLYCVDKMKVNTKTEVVKQTGFIRRISSLFGSHNLKILLDGGSSYSLTISDKEYQKLKQLQKEIVGLKAVIRQTSVKPDGYSWMQDHLTVSIYNKEKEKVIYKFETKHPLNKKMRGRKIFG